MTPHWPTDRSPRWHKPTISALNSGVNERRRRGFFPMLSMIGHPSGGEPLMMDVRQSGSGPLAARGNTAELDPAIQTCQLTDGETSLRYWAIVIDDGEHMNAFRAGSTTLNGQQPTNNYLFIGALTRSAPAAER